MKIKVGDRVKHRDREWKGTVLGVFNSDVWVHIDGDDGAFTYEANKLRRLKPKVKREPRRVWVFWEENHSPSGVTDVDMHGISGHWIEFIEVKK